MVGSGLGIEIGIALGSKFRIWRIEKKPDLQTVVRSIGGVSLYAKAAEPQELKFGELKRNRT